VRGTPINRTTSSRQGEDNGTRVPPLPARLQQVAYRSRARLQVAEAARRDLTHHEHARELDDLFVAIERMSHEERVARLAELGEHTDDLRLPGSEEC
jgi:hypothetical protein